MNTQKSIEYCIGFTRDCAGDEGDQEKAQIAANELVYLQKIKRAVAELNRCDRAYVQALSVDASITKQIDDYDKAIENVLKVYRGKE